MSSSPSSLILAEPGATYRSGASENQWVEVLVDCPRSTARPTARAETIYLQVAIGVRGTTGDILSVPFGSQTLGAIAIRLLDSPPPDLASAQKIQEVEDVACSGYLSTCYFQLLERVAKYYCTPLITAIRVALPPGLLSRSQRRIRLTPAGAAISTDANASGEMSFVGMHNPLLTFLAVSQFYSVLLYFYLRKALEQDLLVKTLALCEVQATVGKVNSPSARQILKLLQAQKDGDYSWQYLQRQVVGASWGLRELLRRGLVESYLEQIRTERPQLKPAVTLVNHTFSYDLTQRQQEILGVLRRRGGDLWLTELLQTCNTTSSTIKKLQEKGYVVIQEREILRTATEPARDRDSPKTLAPSQAEALEVINSLEGLRSSAITWSDGIWENRGLFTGNCTYLRTGSICACPSTRDWFDPPVKRSLPRPFW
jgi:primosomal protein N' (replication factor Y)